MTLYRALLVVPLFLFGVLTLSAQKRPLVTWDHQLIDLGVVKKGEKRAMTFAFTNASDAEVQIDLVDACECTTTDYPRRPIPPGASATIDAVFDSTQKEEGETIDIRVIFMQTDMEGDPIVETVRYRYALER